ncbi:Myb-related protein [Trichinella spiralis]|uniref:Myb-related protein n=1 Tax=Trichinella spiralis TaxID=6334 RepID=A0ABR3L3T5_TRISP
MNPSSLYRSQFSLSLCTECQRFPFPPFQYFCKWHKTDLPSLSTYPITNDKVSMQMTTVRLDNTPRSKKKTLFSQSSREKLNTANTLHMQRDAEECCGKNKKPKKPHVQDLKFYFKIKIPTLPMSSP